MKVRVSILGASAVRDYDEETAIQMFRELSCRVLGLEGPAGKPVPAGPEKVAENVPGPVKMAPPPKLEGYKGFLYLKCLECGVEKGLNIKTPITEFTCRECGAAFAVEDLVPLYVNCECGSSFRYRTNKQENMFDMTCLNCGQPVAVSWNAKKGIYETIR